MFGNSGILMGFDEVTKAWRMAAEDLVGDDACVVKIGGCPQVECVVGNFG